MIIAQEMPRSPAFRGNTATEKEEYENYEGGSNGGCVSAVTT